MFSRVFSIAQFRDGLSQTFFFGEAARDDNEASGCSTSGTVSVWDDGLATAADRAPIRRGPDQRQDKRVGTGLILTGLGPFDRWANPEAVSYGQWGFRSHHPGGSNFVFGDGSVRFLKESIDMGTITGDPGSSRQGVYHALSTRSGGEVIGSDQY